MTQEIFSYDVLNKKSRLTTKEFDEVKKHSYAYGAGILEKNQIKNTTSKNIINYHHAPLYEGEVRCYPQDKKYTQLHLYVRICKLSDIYDAMTSKRSYKEAVNPIVFLRNGQMAYVLDSNGPFILPFTDAKGTTLGSEQNPFIINSSGIDQAKMIDNRRSLKKPKDVFDSLPSYIKKTIKNI